MLQGTCATRGRIWSSDHGKVNADQVTPQKNEAMRSVRGLGGRATNSTPRSYRAPPPPGVTPDCVRHMARSLNEVDAQDCSHNSGRSNYSVYNNTVINAMLGNQDARFHQTVPSCEQSRFSSSRADIPSSSTPAAPVVKHADQLENEDFCSAYAEKLSWADMEIGFRMFDRYMTSKTVMENQNVMVPNGSGTLRQDERDSTQPLAPNPADNRCKSGEQLSDSENDDTDEEVTDDFEQWNHSQRNQHDSRQNNDVFMQRVWKKVDERNAVSSQVPCPSGTVCGPSKQCSSGSVRGPGDGAESFHALPTRSQSLDNTSRIDSEANTSAVGCHGSVDNASHKEMAASSSYEKTGMFSILKVKMEESIEAERGTTKGASCSSMQGPSPGTLSNTGGELPARSDRNHVAFSVSQRVGDSVRKMPQAQLLERLQAAENEPSQSPSLSDIRPSYMIGKMKAAAERSRQLKQNQIRPQAHVTPKQKLNQIITQGLNAPFVRAQIIKNANKGKSASRPDSSSTESEFGLNSGNPPDNGSPPSSLKLKNKKKLKGQPAPQLIGNWSGVSRPRGLSTPDGVSPYMFQTPSPVAPERKYSSADSNPGSTERVSRWSQLTPSSGSYDKLDSVRWQNWKDKFLERYRNCTVSYIDTHCHIDFIYDRSGFSGSYQKFRMVNADTYPQNYAGCVAVFCNPRTFHADGGLWKDLLQEDGVWGAVGCHPKNATDFTDKAFLAMQTMVKHPKVKAVGEIGLDYSGTFSKHSARQKEVFKMQLKVAIEINKPIVIHCRDAEQDCFKIMEETVPTNHLIHRHCFTGSWAEATNWLDKFPNLYIGLTPLVTWGARTERAQGMKEVAARIPLERLVLETDAPYFIPRRVPRDEMPLSHPGMAITVADEVAQIRGLPLDHVLQCCLDNSKRLYGIYNQDI